MKQRLFNKKLNSGMSFVFVIIVIVVVTLIVGAGLVIVNANYNLKSTKVSATDNFYNAEAGLNSIRACLQEHCTEYFEDSYNIIVNSITEIPSTELDNEFTILYLDRIEDTFNNVGSDITPLVKYTRSNSTTVTYLDTSSNFTVSADGIIRNEDNITIKKVVVTYTDGNYIDTIVTDIVLTSPKPFGKAGARTSLIDIYSQYALIADENINIENTGETIKGSIYAGDDISIGFNKACNVHLNSNMILTRKDLLVYPQSRVNITAYKSNKYSDIYVNNLRTAKERENGSPLVYSNRNYNALNIKGNLYVKGDTLLNSKQGNFKLDGQYYGYSTNREGNVNTSAFNINASKINVDLSKASTLWIAGNNYIDIPSILDESNTNDVLMGESLTSKFTQSLYLVPSICIYNEDEDGNRVYLSNPIDKTLYPNYQVDLAINKAYNGVDLTKFTKGSYVGERFVGGYKEVNVQFYSDNKLINRTYLYLDLIDDAMASKYLLEYNILNEDLMTNRAKSFKLGNISIAEDCMVKTNGNTITYDGDNVEIHNIGVGVLDSYTAYQEDYIYNKYDSLVHTLTDVTTDDNDSLFEYMINTDKIRNANHSFSVSNEYFIASNVIQYNNTTESYADAQTIVDSNGQQYYFLVVDGDITLKKDFYGVIIATGDINLISNQVAIHGTLISGKDINFGIPYCSIDNQGANIATLTYLLAQYEGHNLFRDYFNGIESDDIGMSRPENVDISGTIVYKNWMRK